MDGRLYLSPTMEGCMSRTYRIQTLNKIPPKGLGLFPAEKYDIGSDPPEPDAILLRSHKMHGMKLPASLRAGKFGI